MLTRILVPNPKNAFQSPAVHTTPGALSRMRSPSSSAPIDQRLDSNGSARVRAPPGCKGEAGHPDLETAEIHDDPRLRSPHSQQTNPHRGNRPMKSDGVGCFIDTAAAYTAYLQNFGSGAHVSEASQRLVALNESARKAADEKAWADAEKAGTAAAYTAYIQNFGGGAHVAEARQRVAELSRKEADETAWADAEKAGTASAFTSYVQKFGSGAHVAEARQRLAKIGRAHV